MMIRMTYWWTLVILYLLEGIASMPILIPNRTVDVFENDSQTLTCHISIGSYFRWSKNQHIWSALSCFKNTTWELKEGFLKVEQALYTFDCYGNGSFALGIVNVKAIQQNQTWQCGDQFNKSNYVTINVKVPAKSVIIDDSNDDYMKENQTKSIRCKTSACRPDPKVKWYLHNPRENMTYNFTQFSISTIIHEEYGLNAVESSLTFKPNRTLNAWLLYCEVWTGAMVADVTSRKIKINVSFPPDTYPVILGIDTNTTVNVIESDTGTFVCSITGGNPRSTLKWDCFDSDEITPRLYEENNITSSVKWKAYRNFTICSCTSEHIDDWIRITNITINVQYPPNTPFIQISNLKGETFNVQGDIVSIIESETVNVTCFSKSNPGPSYRWRNEQSSQSQMTGVLKFAPIARNNTGNYTCHVENHMVRYFDKAVEGKNSSKVAFNILYPADVYALEDKSAVEGTQFNISCPIIDGNPQSTIMWSRQKDQLRWNNRTLFIKNVSRTDDTIYTCDVTTKMIPTFGKTLTTEKNKSFHLTIFFPSQITTFIVAMLNKNETDVIDKTENASFSCFAEANPSSDLKIINPLGYTVSNVSKSNTVEYTLHNASCVDAGEYTCTGSNNILKGLPSSSKLILFVRCPPRPSSGDTNVVTVATALHKNVTLQFSAREYLDVPNKTAFHWFKENESLSDNGSKYFIHTDGLQTIISIRNTTQRDLGVYQVNVTNSAGSYIHNYDLQATDKPDPPIDFKVINDSITDKSVTLIWSPGFNGGFQQTFVIHYKMVHGTKWLIKSKNDTGKKNMNYTLHDLKSMQEYEIEMFAKNREGNSAKTDRLKFKTESPLAHQVETKTTDNSGIIAGSVSAVAVIVVALTIVCVVYFVRKSQNTKADGLYQNFPFIGKANTRKPKLDTEVKQKKTYNSQTEETTFKGNSSEQCKPGFHYEGKRKGKQEMGNRSKTDKTVTEGLQEVDDVPIIINERTEYCNSKDEIDKLDKRITVAELYAYVFGNEDDLEVEYQQLPTGLQKPCTFARKHENIALNRYNGIYPYDHTRVKIPDQPEFFINACYIDGYKRKKAYIASLGPTSKTTSDFKTFWQMIWNERSDLIIMLTNLHELSGMKCEQYWPDEGKELQYGDVLVTSKTTEVYAEYTVRTFEISKGNQQWPLTHLHYTAWPDKTVPEDVTSLLEFRRRMKDVPSAHHGPAVIHCSAGIGRTGTLIALDLLIEEGLDVGSVNVFECVKILRDQRVKMVQTLEQYVYIHKALVNSLSFECETFTRKSIQHQFDTKNDQHYSKLFKQLNLSVETNSATEQKERTKNTKYSIKNRQGADIPGDRFRVFLQHTDGREGSNYINAVYVNSFNRKDHFITAQSPLPNNVTDFISMIYHGDCSCIATMEDLKEPGMVVGAYLPEKNKAITFGNFEVTSSKFEENTTCVIRKMKIKYTGEIYNGEKCFYHFQYTKWMTGNKTPGDVEDFLQFIQAVEEYADELGEDRSRVVVHCLKANERSCLFCALAIIMEKLKDEGSVNILNVVRHLRTRRRSAIVSKEQLKLCYEAASAYAKSNKT